MKKGFTSNIWFIVTTLVIFFFIYQWLFIYFTVTTDQCVPLYRYWLAPISYGINLFFLFLFIFVLIGLWALVELIDSVTTGSNNKKETIYIGSLILVCVFVVSVSFRAHWEVFEVEMGVRNYEETTFKFYPMLRPYNMNGESYELYEECEIE